MYDDFVSIITPVYNAEKFILQTIHSIQKQSYENWELILIDDGSTDDSFEIIEQVKLKDKRIKSIQFLENLGAAEARNAGIKAAKGRFIAFIDSDDLWKEDKLERQLKFMKANQLGFTFTSYEIINEQGEAINKSVNVPEKINYEQLLKNTIIGCSTVVIDRKIIGEFEMPLIRKGQDSATWLSILKNNVKAYGMNQILMSYRKVEGSLSSNKREALKRTWHIYRKIEGLSFLKSSYVFAWYVFNALRKRV